jgi:hypothetical protein
LVLSAFLSSPSHFVSALFHGSAAACKIGQRFVYRAAMPYRHDPENAALPVYGVHDPEALDAVLP